MSSPTPPSEASAPHGAGPTGDPAPDATSPPPPAAGPAPAGPGRTGAGFFDAIRNAGVARGEDRWIGGVSSGIAYRLGLDPLLVRAAFAVAAVVGGLGLFLYGVAWALLPEQRDGRIHIQEAIEGRFDSALLGAGGFVLVSWASPVTWVSNFTPFNTPWFAGLMWLGLAATVVIVVVAYSQRAGGAGGRSPGTHPPHGAPYGAPAAPAAQTAHPGTWTSAPTPEAPMPGAGSAAPAPATTPTQTWAGPAGPVWQAPSPGVRIQNHSSGGVIFAIAAGLSLLAFAGLWYAERVGSLTAPLALTAIATTVIIMGLATIAAGLAGRSSGAVSFVAIVGLISGLAMATSPDLPRWQKTESFTLAGETAFTPTSRDKAAGGTSVGAGQLLADLTDLDLPAPTAIGGIQVAEPLVVPVAVGLGEIILTMPDDIAYRIEASVSAGEIENKADSTGSTRDGVGVSTVFENQLAQEAGRPDVIVRATVLAGTVTITEETP